MKENKEKEIVGEESRPETQAQARPSVGDKRKPLSKNLDIGNLPSRFKMRSPMLNRLDFTIASCCLAIRFLYFAILCSASVLTLSIRSRFKRSCSSLSLS